MQSGKSFPGCFLMFRLSSDSPIRRSRPQYAASSIQVELGAEKSHRDFCKCALCVLGLVAARNLLAIV